jgi:uncharacterized protein (TIGR00369 family)
MRPGIETERIEMRKINPEYKRIICQTASKSPYFTLLSMSLRDFDIGRSLLEIDLEEKHLQPFGMVHGGVFASILDAAAFWAVYPEGDEDCGMTTVDLKINYLAPAVSGRLVAQGRRIKLGRTLGLGEAEVADENGRILAHGTSILMVLPQFPIQAHQALPAKFIEE